MNPSPSGDLQRDIERFLYREAWLLDERHFHQWLDLFTEDCRYSLWLRETVQSREEGIAPPTEASAPVFDDDKSFLTVRVKRLETRLAHAEQPPSLTRHLITNVLVHEGETATAVEVSSNFLVYQSRIDISEHTFFGKREDLLRHVDGEWKIARRRVVLDAMTLPRTITVFF